VVENIDQSQHTSRSGKCSLELEIFHTRLSSRKDQKGLESEDPLLSVTTYKPAVASPTEQLYEQMTSNPALTKRNIQNSKVYLLNIFVRS